MVIKLKVKNSIGKRIMIGFIGILIITFIITTVLYSAFSERVVISQARIELRKSAAFIEKSIENLYSMDINERTRNTRLYSNISLINKFIGTQTILIDSNDNVVYPRTGWDIREVKRFKKELRLEESDYIVYEHFIKNTDLPIKSIVIFNEYKGVAQLKNKGIKNLIFSFLIGLIISIVVGYTVSKRIYKPIKALNANMKDYNNGINKELKVYQSNDEIQDLSETFKTLTDRITKLNENQKQFFQNSSHELKTPLMSIQGYAEAIKDGIVKDEEVDNSLDIIISETQRLKNIVDDVIYLSKIDSLEDEFIMKDASVMKIIKESMSAVNPLLKANNINVEINCDESIVLKCDFEKMKRVFINLLGNGSRYAKSKIVVNINEDGNNLTIDVIDDGKGFEYGQEEKVFDRFFNGKKGGSGIGLALTREIIERHNGKIIAINNINFGAIFKITLMKDNN